MARPKKSKDIDPFKDKLLEPSEPKAVPKTGQGLPLESVCIDSLLSDAMKLITGELDCIKREAAGGKLLPEISRDLVSYTKLLYDIKNDSSDALVDYTDEELTALTRV